MKTVFVGMSGGVDSSVAALRLKNQGYDVVGVFIKVWHPDWLVCNWEQERLDAMRVAAHLKIPFLTCNAEIAYKQGVADYFISEYAAGRTPNPDVMCNQQVKFGAFLDFALERGADYIATGHYVQRKDSTSGVQLLRGVDTSKDQSYFLWTLTQKQLTHSLFPVGDTPKDNIRAEAAKNGLPTAAKKDSQGVCFLGHIDIAEFLSHYIDLQPGAVLNEVGEAIGEHQGAFVYTLGQRHGFNINTYITATTPHYVTARDITANTITVAHTPPHTKPTTTITLHDCNWIPTSTLGVLEAQFRYRQTPIPVTVTERTDTTAVLQLGQETDAIAAGQSCVLYEGVRCLGGGIIG